MVDVINDMARQWCSCDHIREVLRLRIRVLGGWICDRSKWGSYRIHANPSKPLPRADDICVALEQNSTWYICFRAGNDEEKLRIARTYVHNRRVHTELSTRAKAQGILAEVHRQINFINGHCI